jgi:UDPglucose 6-dehydrogenase
MGLDSRIGSKFLTPGPGWGGSCFPKDSKALSSIFEQNGLTSPLILASLESNEKAKRRVVEAISRAADGALEGKRVAVWGLAFKANTDDTRDSPAVSIITRLIDRGARVVAYDPEVKALNLEGLAIAESAIEAARDADVLAVLTEWPEFGVVDALATMQNMRSQCVVDARRVLDASLWKPLSSHFFVIGETS